MVDVFISYKKERRDYAERLAGVLEAHGYHVFWDYELVVGPSYSAQLMDNLTASKAVVVLWCSGSVQSTFVIDEATRARNAGKLLPAQIELVEPPLGFGIDQMALLARWDGEPEAGALAPLIDGVARLAAKPPRKQPNVISLLRKLPPLAPPARMETTERVDPNPSARPERPQAGASLKELRGTWAAIKSSGRLRQAKDFLFNHARGTLLAYEVEHWIEDFEVSSRKVIVQDGTDAGFDQEVVNASRDRPIIVDFWAPWCGPCKTLGPLLEDAVRATGGAVRLVKINIDENSNVAGQLGVREIPAVFAFDNGRPIDGFMGAIPESEIKKFIGRLTTSS